MVRKGRNVTAAWAIILRPGLRATNADVVLTFDAGLPDDFYSELEVGLSSAERRLTTNAPAADAEEAVHRLNLLSTHLGLRNYGPIPYGVIVCASSAISCLLTENNAGPASTAVNVVEGMRHGIPEALWKHIFAAVEHDFERISAEFSHVHKGLIITPSDFVHSQTTFTNQTDVQPLIVSAADKFNSLLIQRFMLDPGQLYSMSSRSFEELIAEVFNGFGFDVELTKPTRDGGRDIIAVKHVPSRLRCLVECKRYAADNKVDVGIVRELMGVLQDDGAQMASWRLLPFSPSQRRNSLVEINGD